MNARDTYNVSFFVYQISCAAKKCHKQFKKLYKFIFQGFMLYLWLWYPKFVRSAARALGYTIGIDGCTPLNEDDVNDRFHDTHSCMHGTHLTYSCNV